MARQSLPGSLGNRKNQRNRQKKELPKVNPRRQQKKSWNLPEGKPQGRGRKKKKRLRQGQPPSQQRRKTEQPRQSPPKGMRPRLEKVRRDRQKEGELS